MSFSVEGRTAIVTGAANGIGLAIARHLLGEGARVMLVDMDEAKLVAEIEALPEESREHAVWFAGDLREKLTLTNLMAATVDAFDRLDILVNACRQVMVGDPLACGDDTVEYLLQQNLMIALRLSQIAARRMIAQAAEDGNEDAPVGSIINISSIAARRTQPELLAFSVSTAALDQLTRSLAVALAGSRIRVNAVACGSIMSDSLRSTLKEHGDYAKTIVERTPLHRIAGPKEVAETVQFLASESSAFMTGQILTLDGGRTLIDPVKAPAH